MGFPNSVSEKVLVDSGRCCSICHKFCGTKIELHHIKQAANGGTDTYENCIALCFDCHADVKAYNPKHPKGKKYSEKELLLHRDRWYGKISSSVGVGESSDYVQLDIVTFAKFRDLLSEQRIPFLYHYDYHSSFDIETIEAINTYIDRCYDPSFEFIDSDIEQMKQKLCKEFFNLMVIKDTYMRFSEDYKTYIFIGDDVKHSETLHKATLAIKDVFDDIIKLGRRKYKVM